MSKARAEALEDENDNLRHQLLLLERELHSKTPSKPRGRKGVSSVANVVEQRPELELFSGLRDGNGNGNGGPVALMGGEKTPRKVRKLTGKKAVWDVDGDGDENSMESL